MDREAVTPGDEKKGSGTGEEDLRGRLSTARLQHPQQSSETVGTLQTSYLVHRQEPQNERPQCQWEEELQGDQV